MKENKFNYKPILKFTLFASVTLLLFWIYRTFFDTGLGVELDLFLAIGGAGNIFHIKEIRDWYIEK